MLLAAASFVMHIRSQYKVDKIFPATFLRIIKSNHPNRETSYICTKHNIYMCEECIHCRDPEIYCKYRSSCPIHFLTKRKKILDAELEPVQKSSTEQEISKTCADRL
jgi:hypothetical protein